MASLLIIVLFTVIAVFTRYILNRPIPGDNEITELIMVLAVFFGAVAVAQLDKSHVNIDIALEKITPRGRYLTEAITTLFGILLVGLIVWRTGMTAWLFAVKGNETRMMAIPFAPFAFVIPLGCFLLLLVLVDNLIGYFRQAAAHGYRKTMGIFVPAITVLLLLLILLWLRRTWQIDALVLGVAGLLFCVILFITGMPVTFAMFITGILGMAYLRGMTPALSFLGDSVWRTTANYSFSVAPLFIAMGYFILHSDISEDLFNAAYKWIGWMHGGLASAAIAACAAYGAVVGVPFIGPISMGAVALPEMKRYGYADSLSTGSICAGSTLGTLIPPSVPLVFYGILTQQSIGKLFVAGIVPGLFIAGVWILQAYGQCRINPRLGPPGPAFSLQEKTRSLIYVWPVLVLFFIVLGGMYKGVFTPVEAGGFGAVGALLIGICLRRYTWTRFISALYGAGVVVGMIFLMLAGAKLMGSFFVLSRFPYALSGYLAGLALPPTVIILILCAVIIVLSCFIDGLVLLFIVVPIFYPIIQNMGFDPIWFGVVIVTLTNIGALTPPFAINVFAIRVVAKDVPIITIYRGVFPFMITCTAALVVMILFPEMVTWLPNLMDR
jgi:tripartite ATP-independent transporter DctM subunit